MWAFHLQVTSQLSDGPMACMTWVMVWGGDMGPHYMHTYVPINACAISTNWHSPRKPPPSSRGLSGHVGKSKLLYISLNKTCVFGLKNPFWNSWNEKVKPALEPMSCFPLVSTFGESSNWAKEDQVISSEFIGQMIWKPSACPSGSLPCV